MTRAIGLIFLLALAGCSGIGGSALKGVTGAVLGADSGPSLDVQAGKTNNRSLVGGTETTEQKFIPRNRDNQIENLNQNSTQSADTKTVETQSVESLNINQIPTWLLISMAGIVALFGLVGWVSPQPRWIRNLVGSMNCITIAFLVIMYAGVGHLYFSNLDLSGVICAQIDGPQEKTCR